MHSTGCLFIYSLWSWPRNDDQQWVHKLKNIYCDLPQLLIREKPRMSPIEEAEVVEKSYQGQHWFQCFPAAISGYLISTQCLQISNRTGDVWVVTLYCSVPRLENNLNLTRSWSAAWWCQDCQEPGSGAALSGVLSRLIFLPCVTFLPVFNIIISTSIRHLNTTTKHLLILSLPHNTAEAWENASIL